MDRASLMFAALALTDFFAFDSMVRSIVAKDSMLEIQSDTRIYRIIANSADEAQLWKCSLQNLQVDVVWDLATGARQHRTQSVPCAVVHHGTIRPRDGRKRSYSGYV